VLDQIVYATGERVRVSLQNRSLARLGGYLPARLLLQLPEETLDTRENRFAALVLRAINESVTRVAETEWLWRQLPPTDRGVLEELRATAEQTLAATFLGDLPSGTAPPGSQVLARRPGYREITQFWHALGSGRRSVTAGLDAAAANRDVAQLYEYWCLFALTDLLEAHLGPVLHIRNLVGRDEGVRPGAVVRFENGARLLFNQGFRRPNSYSVGLRPDFTLIPSRGRRIAFDAKFRFDSFPTDTEIAEDASEVAGIAAAKVDDLYKMHTYRDALHLGAAVVLYPGTESVFYERHGTRRSWDVGEAFPLAPVLAGEWVGIGAIALQP